MSEKKRELGYSDDLDPTDQVDAEEWIASLIFHYHSDGCLNEETAEQLGRDILEEILWRFSPNYFAEEES